MGQNKRTSIRFILVMVSIFMLLSATSLTAAKPSSQSVDCQPLLIYDICGYGLAGPTQLHLTVYSNGVASISWLGPRGSYAEFTTVPKRRIYWLVDSLIGAGALKLTDRSEKAPDTPMTTVTIFADNGANAFHNTFSFYTTGSRSDPAKQYYDQVVRLVNSFIDASFSNQR
jgi:hypothetical protein